MFRLVKLVAVHNRIVCGFRNEKHNIVNEILIKAMFLAHGFDKTFHAANFI